MLEKIYLFPGKNIARLTSVNVTFDFQPFKRGKEEASNQRTSIASFLCSFTELPELGPTIGVSIQLGVQGNGCYP
jgi:hypothetical protein